VIHVATLAHSTGRSARTSTASGGVNAPRTKSRSTSPGIGAPGPTPTRRRAYSCVPSASSTLLSPLCPPAEPLARKRNEPSGSATSSTMTSRSLRTAEIHERERLEQPHAMPGDDAVGRAGGRGGVPRGETPNVGQVVNDPPADVVTRVLVFLPRIAEADDEFHGGKSPRPSSRPRRPPPPPSCPC